MVIGATVEDSADHVITAANATFTTGGSGTTLSDTTAPTATVTTATISNSGNAVVRSTETGTAYLVNTAVTVSNLDSITVAAYSQWNSVVISSASTDTNLAATGLADGTYKVYAVDAAGNLSSASSNSVTVDTTAPKLISISPANGSDNVSVVSTTGYEFSFNEEINPSTIETNSSTTDCGGYSETIQISPDNFSTNTNCLRLGTPTTSDNMTFSIGPILLENDVCPTFIDPSNSSTCGSNLMPGTNYQIKVTSQVKDLAGNTLNGGTDNLSNFTSKTRPYVSSTSPDNGSNDVRDNGTIVLHFSKAMTSASLDNTTVTISPSLTGGLSVSYDNASDNLSISAVSGFDNNTAYTITILDNKTYGADEKIFLSPSYSITFTTIDNSLVAYYPFNGNANDLTSNGRDFTVYGDTTLTNGKDNSSNSAYSFDGNGDYLQYTANIPSFDNYTISLWAKPASSGTYEAMFSSYNDAGEGFQIDLSSGNFHIRKAGASGGNIVLSTAQLGVWTFIAFTYAGTNSIGYINSDNESPVSGGTTEFNRFRIGRNRNGNTYFSGAIDELRIYNRALTASEISSLYTN